MFERVRRTCFFSLILTFTLVPVTTAQSSSNSSTAERDPQAMAIVQQVLAANGGAAALQTVADFKAIGQIEYNTGKTPLRGGVTILSRGVDQSRFEATLEGGTRRWTLSYGSGKFEPEQGRAIAIHDAGNYSGAVTLPVLKLARAVLNPTVSITEAGTTHHGAYDIRVTTPLTSTKNPSKQTQVPTTVVDYIIEPTTLVIRAVADKVQPDSEHAFDRMTWFSDFQPINGIEVPFTISEFVGSTKGWTVTLSSISFNTGLTDADFRY